MKKTLKKISAMLLTLVCLFGICACGKGGNETIPKLPEYSAKQFEFMSYSGPMNGKFSIDGVVKTLGPDKRTVEGYTEFKDAGFTMLMLAGSAGYNGNDWDNSECKRAWTAAAEAGIEKIILDDKRFEALVGKKDSLVGAGGEFATEEELTEYVKECMSDYKDMPGFYGYRLSDERDYTYTKSMGYVYKAIKNAGKELGFDDLYIHLNVLPLTHITNFAESPESITGAYESYVGGNIEATECDRISSDVYMFSGSGITGSFYTTAQLFRKQCDENGVDMSFCLQSFEMYSGTRKAFRRVGKAEMFAEMYSLIGMGVDHFAYFTYQPMENSTSSKPFTDGTNFITRSGEKTNVYYAGQKTMATAQKMADIVLSYDYKGAKFYTAAIPNFDTSCYFMGWQDPNTNTTAQFDNSHEFTLLKEVGFDNDVVFATELYDSDNGLYMYMLQNVIDPANAEYGRTAEKITAQFDGYAYVAELHGGELSYVKLDGGKYTKLLDAGDAVFLIPLK